MGKDKGLPLHFAQSIAFIPPLHSFRQFSSLLFLVGRMLTGFLVAFSVVVELVVGFLVLIPVSLGFLVATESLLLLEHRMQVLLPGFLHLLLHMSIVLPCLLRQDLHLRLFGFSHCFWHLRFLAPLPVVGAGGAPVDVSGRVVDTPTLQLQLCLLGSKKFLKSATTFSRIPKTRVGLIWWQSLSVDGHRTKSKGLPWLFRKWSVKRWRIPTFVRVQGGQRQQGRPGSPSPSWPCGRGVRRGQTEVAGMWHLFLSTTNIL